MPRCPGIRPTRRVLAVLVLLAVVTAAIAVGPAGAAPPPPGYRPPVDAPVVDPFRLPSGRYGAGNRGLEYDTRAGVAVLAAADGQVSFAGLVAGSRHVTVLHGDGLRTTVSYLGAIDVVVGQRVRQGDRLGTSGEGPLHFGARRGDAYLDPASLFAEEPPRVQLVPFDVPPGPGPEGERSAIRQLLGLGAEAWGVATDAASGVVGLSDDALDWLQATSPELLRTAVHYAVQGLPGLGSLDLVVRAVDVLQAAWGLSHRPCTDPQVAARPPPGRRVVIQVAGLGSTSEHGAIARVATDALGYDDEDVIRFSYAGGHTPGAGGALAGSAARRYATTDTTQDLRVSGHRLADLVEVVAAERPGLPVDLFAHSQGGLVAHLGLIELEARHGRAWLDQLGLFATLASPHGGADLATAIDAIETTAVGSGLLDEAGRWLAPGLDPGSVAAGQLSETSDLVRYLADHPIPGGVRAVSIAARGDVVVPVPRTRLAGATEVVVPIDGASAHGELPASPEATRELALALAGAPPTCMSLASALLAEFVGAAISRAEDHLGAGAWGAAGALEVFGPLPPREDRVDAPAP